MQYQEAKRIIEQGHINELAAMKSMISKLPDIEKNPNVLSMR